MGDEELHKTRFEHQLSFLIEVDKMKNVLRQTLLADGSRQETDAEHSWHFALMSMVLYEYCTEPHVDLNQVIKMALVHDLVEIYAGDTFAYDIQGNQDKALREKQAADKLFGLLPEDQGMEYRKLWEEFDAMETPEARYAASIDRLQPLINNLLTQGHPWRKGHVTSSQVYQRMEPIRHSTPDLWPFVEESIQDSVAKGYLQP